jgi:hypothetical protein
MQGLTPSAYGAKALDNACSRVRNAPVGERHNTILSASASCGRIPEEHLPYHAAFGQLMDAALDAGEELQRARQTIRDGLQFGRRNVREMESREDYQSTPKHAPYELPRGLRDALGRRVEFPLEWRTAWELASVSELQAQRDVVQSWDYLADRVDIPLVVATNRLIREVASERHPNTDAPVYALRQKIEAGDLSA